MPGQYHFGLEQQQRGTTWQLLYDPSCSPSRWRNKTPDHSEHLDRQDGQQLGSSSM